MKLFKTNEKRRPWAWLIAVIGAALLGSLLWIRIGSLTYGNAAAIEAATKLSASSWSAILENPLNAPYTVIQRIVDMTGHHGITSLRLISTLFAAAAALLFYLVARQWHNTRVALLASWLFVSSSWFLHTARLGSPEILWLVSILGLVVLLTPSRNGERSPWAFPFMLLVLSLVLYVPGMVWLVIAGVIFQRKSIAAAWRSVRKLWVRIAGVLAALAAITPLVYGLARSPSLVKHWLGLPVGSRLADLTPLNIGESILGVPMSLFYKSSFDAVHWLSDLPLLSSFEIIMFLLGAFFYATHIRAARTRLIIVLAGVALLLVGIMGMTSVSLVVPVAYLLIAAGIAYILHLWLKVFPNNPIARFLGICIIMLAVVLTSVYQTRSYFVAWRYNDDTAKSFQIRL
ncbi:MAG TPA: hypothetical protein VF572_01860 [Candidatus Saccharimonadales bacterium]|jgi:hypothetical protein